MPLVEVVSKPCPGCRETKTFELELEDVRRWAVDKEHIQNVWPKMSSDDRERLITGYCPKCWDELFKED